MEAAIQTVVKVFLKSTKGKESLGKKEFQTLVKSQLSNILSDTDSKEAVNNMGQGLDADHDGKVGFEEYMKLVGYLAVSLSEQRNLAKEEPAQNATTATEAQSAPDKEGGAEAKEGADGEATTEAKVEATADGNVEAKAEAETQPEAAKEEEPAAAAAVEVAAEAATAEVVAESLEVTVKEEVVVEEVTEKEAAPAGDQEEEGEKKTEEAAS